MVTHAAASIGVLSPFACFIGLFGRKSVFGSGLIMRLTVLLALILDVRFWMVSHRSIWDWI